MGTHRSLALVCSLYVVRVVCGGEESATKSVMLTQSGAAAPCIVSKWPLKERQRESRENTIEACVLEVQSEGEGKSMRDAERREKESDDTKRDTE